MVSSAENIIVDLDEMSGHAHSVNKYVAESHADVEGVNSVQGTIECVNNVQDKQRFLVISVLLSRLLSLIILNTIMGMGYRGIQVLGG